MAATTKRKKVAKNSKQSWRKHSDINDVEEFLEELRREERTDGPVSEKADKSLFFVEKKTQETVHARYENSNVKAWKRKLLKVDELVLPVSKVEPLRSRKRKFNRKKKQESNQNDSSSDSDVEPEKSLSLIAEKRKPQTVQLFDLWETKVAPNADEHFQRTTKTKSMKPPKSINRKTSGLKAIEVCSPGASYNPVYEDHQALLQIAHHVELKKDNESEKWRRHIKLLTPEEVANLPTWTEEMSEGLFVEDDKDEDEAESDASEVTNFVAPVNVMERKTKKERRKEKRKRALQKELEAKKKAKLKEKQDWSLCNRLESLKEEILQADHKAEERRKKKQEMRETLPTKPLRLSKCKYQAPNIEIKLSDEITGDLRTLKVIGLQLLVMSVILFKCRSPCTPFPSFRPCCRLFGSVEYRTTSFEIILKNLEGKPS
ncbi:PREDICTED: glioma tumor suppressor candidate region gene 2 protein-like isoform X3 [Acropora digitifera]|uniref:glioma tumor suppressor candidate region gene 2 protein-like isoform X3 n=1 Tax=Acropora digitifera TaxID=70779 RepID=UPI00077A5DAC|nr:PREDICTED: glioma tumor suppressor candidate region gene 2 protein-like isoform X3 [Acropora digitifera]